MGMNVGGGGGLNSDINVTPLVDVVLVLLIIFMVIVPLAQMGYNIEIPKEAQVTIPQDVQEKQVILSVSAASCNIVGQLPASGLPPDCMVRINKDDVRASDLPDRLQEVFKNRKASEKILFLAAEEKLNYEGVMQILDLARTGVGEDLKIGIVTDEKIALGVGAGG